MADANGNVHPSHTSGNTFPAHFDGDVYPETTIAVASNPHFGWYFTPDDVTFYTGFGPDTVEEFLYHRPLLMSFEDFTTSMALPLPYFPSTWGYLCHLQEKTANLEQQLAALRTLVAKTSEKDDTNDGLTQSEIVPRPAPVATNIDRVISPRIAKKYKANNRLKRKYNRRPKRDINAPNRPLTGYAQFANDIRTQNSDSDLAFTQRAKLIGQLWQQCATEVRQRYLDTAEAEKQDYEGKLSRYKKSHAFDLYQNYRMNWEASKGRSLKARQGWTKCEQIAEHLGNTGISSPRPDVKDRNLVASEKL